MNSRKIYPNKAFEAIGAKARLSLNADVLHMKTKPIILATMMVLGVAILGTSCSTAVGIVTSDHRDWNFIQDVGGIRVGDPIPATGDIWNLPVECDVSGLTEITTKPKGINSALVVKDIKSRTMQDKILIWVVVCVVTDKYKEPHWTKGIHLEGIKEGKYSVQYLNPDGTTVGIRSIELRKYKAEQGVAPYVAQSAPSGER